MITGMLAVRNIIFGEKNDLWSVNTDLEYQEEILTSKEEEEVIGVFKETLIRVFSRLDPVALGLAVGITSCLFLLLASITLLIKDGEIVGPHLQLLSQFLPGYQVAWFGSLIGGFYALVLGFLAGWGFAYIRNLTIYLSAKWIHRDIESDLLRSLLDFN
jgi:hypothetical protein